ncbi:unnamed protein product [Pleuronectes platessa]|uniref:Uncharacterized protein n=1 Tax=Pleuronectes platessa TaxID=8262 RepID=A0A9N7TY33_PLEPL|nr:unnamed protein product [Pleuronectes platessa]
MSPSLSPSLPHPFPPSLPHPSLPLHSALQEQQGPSGLTVPDSFRFRRPMHSFTPPPPPPPPLFHPPTPPPASPPPPASCQTDPPCSLHPYWRMEKQSSRNSPDNCPPPQIPKYPHPPPPPLLRPMSRWMLVDVCRHTNRQGGGGEWAGVHGCYQFQPAQPPPRLSHTLTGTLPRPRDVDEPISREVLRTESVSLVVDSSSFLSSSIQTLSIGRPFVPPPPRSVTNERSEPGLEFKGETVKLGHLENIPVFICRLATEKKKKKKKKKGQASKPRMLTLEKLMVLLVVRGLAGPEPSLAAEDSEPRGETS